MKHLVKFLAFFIISFSTQAKNNELIANFSQVNEGIFRGARLTSKEAGLKLQSLEVKNIINLQGGDLESIYKFIIPWAEPGERPSFIAAEKALAESLGIGFFHSPLNSLDEINAREDKQIDAILDFMGDKNNWPLFIHCEHGADRTGLLVALYRVKYEGVSAEDARAEWIRKGHNKLHRIFTGELDIYFFKKVKEYNQ
ncbi:MAG: tyrosine-protein phosphatase [Bacteriovorax sp.]|nr:tyrosine-protein phosphatase [Bacteriovorax sp.]